MRFIHLIAVFTVLTVCKALRFNKPRILLPVIDEVRVSYTLEVLEKGCFDFRVSSGPELIQIQPIWDNNEDCTYKVAITTTSREKTKKTAILLAESKETGEILRCDVILDVIHSFNVHTTTRDLYLEEAPETFELKAQDSAGNDFTTLEGVEFNWILGLQSRNTKDQSGQTRQQVLRFLTFSESKYHHVPKEVEKFETMGKKGHMVLLDGINSGSARVIVKLPYPEYQNVPEVKVDITVLANLIIDPIRVHILVGDTANFKVFQLKRGKLHEITLGPQYYLEIVNTAHAKIDGGVATGLTLGSTDVVLRDRNVIEKSEKLPMPKARLTVAEADKITLNLLPHYNWVTVVNEKNEIAIDVYTKGDEKITLGTAFSVKSEFDGKMFKELERNVNGSRIYGEAVKIGTNQVAGSFSKLVANAEMLIYAQIELEPRFVILPYDVNKPAKQTIQFIASGGDGSFVFSTSSPNIFTIDSTGLADSHLEKVKDSQYETTGSAVHTSVKAAITRNPKIFKTAEVLFMPPVNLRIVSFNLETALDDYLDLHIGLFANYNNALVPFSACENLQFDVEFSNPIVKIMNMDFNSVKAKDGCRIIRLQGIQTGSTAVTVTYRHGAEIFIDKTQLLVHHPLKVFNPESNVVVLPIGSSRNIIYQYGPRKSFIVGSELVRNLKFDNSIFDVVEVPANYQEQRFGYNILCRKVGDAQLKLEVWNELHQENVIKNSAIIVTTVLCVKPRFINLLSLDKVKTACPIDSKSSLMHVRSLQESLDIEIEVLDHNKRKLHNITSLYIDLQFSRPSGAINHNIVYEQESEHDEIDGVAVPRRDLVRTSISEVNVNHKIKAIVKDYAHKVLLQSKIHPESPVFGVLKSSESRDLVTPLIENELNFLSFDSSLLPVASISVFLAAGLTERIRLGQGSGFYEIRVKNPSLLEAVHEKSELVLTPKEIGETIVEIVDRCLKTEPARLHVSIVSVNRIELATLDRVEKGKTIEARVKLIDSNNQPLKVDFSKIDVYHISEKIFNERTLGMKQGDQSQLNKGEIRYIISGNELGETKIVVSSGAISSSPTTVQVFQPLQLLPRNATILVGSLLEVTSRGGPKPDTNIIYQVVNSDILTIDGSVVEGQKVGKTKVIGRSTGINPIDGSTIIFTEDSIFITVIPLNKISIRTPLQRIKAGNVMPVTLWAEPDVSPMVLGSLKNLKIRWQIDAQDVLELKDVFEDVGVIYGEADVISMRARGLKQGKTRISVTVFQGSSKFLATTDVSVYKTLELESPKRIVHDPIIIPPQTSLPLKVNLEEAIFEVNEQADSSVINVSRDGIVKTFETLGTSLLVATCNDQKLDIPVEVKSVNYIMATVQPNGNLKGVRSSLPRDLSFVISVSLHDNLGNVFSHSFEDIKWKLSNKNTVEVRATDNFTISIGLLRESSNLLAISLRDAVGIKNAEDYIKLAVKAPLGIFNKKLLVTTGDIVCFESLLSGNTFWQSSSSEVLLQGSVGRVIQAPVLHTSVFVRNGDKNGFHMNFELDVRQPDRIQFQKAFDIFNGETYRGFFTISNHQQVDKRTNIIASNKSHCDDLQESFPVDFVFCKLTTQDSSDILKKFETSAVFDKAAGSYACEIRSLTSLEDITSIARSRTVNLQLEVRLASGILDKTDLKLAPAVLISPKILSLNHLYEQEIVVTGMENILQKLEISTSHPDNLILTPSAKTSINAQFGERRFKLKLHNPFAVDDEMSVNVNSPLTQQLTRIPIVPQSQNEKVIDNGWVFHIMSNIGKITAIIVIVLTTIALVLMCQRNRELDTSGVFQNNQSRAAPNQTLINNNSNGNIFTATPLQSQRTSPIRLSPSLDQQQQPVYGDPTIPSPFRRYHKRTL